MNCHFQQRADEKENILRNDVKEVEKQRRGEVCESQTAQAAFCGKKCEKSAKLDFLPTLAEKLHHFPEIATSWFWGRLKRGPRDWL